MSESPDPEVTLKTLDRTGSSPIDANDDTQSRCLSDDSDRSGYKDEIISTPGVLIRTKNGSPHPLRYRNPSNGNPPHGQVDNPSRFEEHRVESGHDRSIDGPTRIWTRYNPQAAIQGDGHLPARDANPQEDAYLPPVDRSQSPARFELRARGDANHLRSKPGLTFHPETFDGQGDWEEYLSHFELCAQLGRWDWEDMVLALAASLRSAARTFYMGLTRAEKGHYPSLIRRLGDRFGSVRQQNRWLSRLEMRQRHPDESAAVLGDDLRRMAQRAYCDLDTVAQEVLALNQLYKIISPEMKCRCIDRDCRTVADAVDVIERYESIMGEPKGRIKSSVRRVTVPSEPDQS